MHESITYEMRFPTGEYTSSPDISAAQIAAWVDEIAAFPAAMRQAVADLSDAQLDTPYRPQGWTVRQVVHHCADSHMNALIRFRLALTEDNPTIRPYLEALWAELPDGKAMSVEPSLQILEGLHDRWASLLRTLGPAEFARGFYHPEHSRSFLLDDATGMYAWHCRHHLAHVTHLRSRMGW